MYNKMGYNIPDELIDDHEVAKTSIDLARDYGRDHKYIMCAIYEAIEGLKELGIPHSESFKEIIVHEPNGKKQVAIEMDVFGITFLVLNFDLSFYHFEIYEY